VPTKKASKFSSEATFYVIKSSYAVAGYQYMEDEKSKNPGEAMVTYQCINQKWYLNDIKTIQKTILIIPSYPSILKQYPWIRMQPST